MANKLFSTLVPKVNPSVPGCPQPMIIQYIRDSAIRTCERTLAWRYEVPKYPLVPGVFEYPYVTPAGSEVHAVFEAILNGQILNRLTLEQALIRYPHWADQFNGLGSDVYWSGVTPHVYNEDEYNEEEYNAAGCVAVPSEAVTGGTPIVICQVHPSRFIVLPIPGDKEYIMRMFVALKPSRNSTGMEQHMLDELEDVIIHGALQHLCALPKVHWADRELAAYHAKQYLFHLSERRARANLGNVRGTKIFSASRYARWA